MNFRLFKSMLLIFFLSLASCSLSFSQKFRGTYKPVIHPVDAPYPPKTSDNVLEFPVKLTEAIIELKLFHRLKWIETNLDGSNPKISKGRWTNSGKTITLKFKPADSLGTINMEFVKMKSGEYIKLVNDFFFYYKKE